MSATVIILALTILLFGFDSPKDSEQKSGNF